MEAETIQNFFKYYKLVYNIPASNSVLKLIYEDYATIRRYLIEYGFMERTNDCKEYWVKW